jgi:hypothetical protein
MRCCPTWPVRTWREICRASSVGREVDALLAGRDGSAARLPALMRTIPLDPARWRVALLPGAAAHEVVREAQAPAGAPRRDRTRRGRPRLARPPCSLGDARGAHTGRPVTGRDGAHSSSPLPAFTGAPQWSCVVSVRTHTGNPRMVQESCAASSAAPRPRPSGPMHSHLGQLAAHLGQFGTVLVGPGLEGRKAVAQLTAGRRPQRAEPPARSPQPATPASPGDCIVTNRDVIHDFRTHRPCYRFTTAPWLPRPGAGKATEISARQPGATPASVFPSCDGPAASLVVDLPHRMREPP